MPNLKTKEINHKLANHLPTGQARMYPVVARYISSWVSLLRLDQFGEQN